MKRRWISDLTLLMLFSSTAVQLFSNSQALPKSSLYPYGQREGDQSLDPVVEDSTSDEITFPSDVPARFYGSTYTNAYVNENGLISFETDVPFYQNQHLSLFEYATIAGFYADVDIRNYQDPTSRSHGSVYYRVTQDPNLLQRAARLVQSKFTDAQNFEAKWLLVATWDDVGYHEGEVDKKNTFQTVLIAGAAQTYVELLYPENGIQWIRSNSRNANQPDTPAQVGFVSDDNRHEILDYSGSEEIANIDKRSNVGDNGHYLFRVSGGDVQAPAEVTGLGAAMVPSERLQPLDIGGDGQAGMNQQQAGQHQDGDEDVDNEYYYDPPDADDYDHPPPVATEMRPGAHPAMAPASTQYADTAGPLEPAPPALGPEEHPAPEEATTPMQTIEDPAGTSPPVVDNPEEADVDVDDDNVEEPADPAPWPQPPPAPPTTDQDNDDNRAQVPAPTLVPVVPTPVLNLVPVVPPPGPYPHAPGNVVPGPSCALGGQSVCHPNAQCRDHQTGSCCQCQPGFFGNGRQCLQEGEPQRINGRFSGRINEVDIPETDLHTYVVTSDGRVYTALSQIPQQVGRPLLLLASAGSVMNWLFGKPSSPNAYNGYALTGGVLNRTATVHISDRYTVTVQQEFAGIDQFNYLKTRIYVTGSLPEVPEGVEVEYGDYNEQYIRYGPGIVKSYSNKPVQVGGERHQITIDDTIRFEECLHKQFDKDHTTILHADRSYTVYDPAEMIVRYAGAYTIEANSDAKADPCLQGGHDCTGAHMTCVRDGRSYRCACRDGFELSHPPEAAAGQKGVCVDRDECSRSTDRCSRDADCLNTEGSYRCVCRPGFRGNGFTCDRVPEQSVSEAACASLGCDRNAECRPSGLGQLQCLCKPGYKGNGYYCAQDTQEPIGPACTSHDQCHRHGQCVYNQAIRQYQCQCRPPYSGDGRHCFLEAESCDKARNCDQNADCVWQQLPDIGGGYMCRCRAGYTGDGYRCTLIENTQEVQCNVVNNCDPHAQCKFDNNQGRFVCQCLSGYEGNGLTCRPVHQVQPSTGHRPCQSVDDCHPYAHCVNQETSQDYVCECLPGFKGDGVASCEPADQCTPGATGGNQCHPNAACLYDDNEIAYVCKCNEGYVGDGKTCTEPAATCELQNICHQHAHCGRTQQGEFKCVCNPGYEGDGTTNCQPDQPPAAATCDRDPSLCHQDAECAWDHQRGGYVCRCKPGYLGDGTTCAPDRVSCELQNICHPQAQCQRTQQGDFKCVCNPGYEGDGTNCQPASDCLVNPKLCDANAVCVSENFRYVCRCKPGYHGNGQTCNVDSELRGRTLAFTHGVAVVQRGLLQDDLGKQIIVVPHQIAVGLDYDCQDDKLFWTDVSGHAIRSAYMDGSNLTTLFTEGLNSPEGLVLDWASKNVYYTDSQLDIIGVAGQDGKYRAALVKDGLVNPRALAIDMFEKKLYYSDWYRQKPVIGRLNLDGTGREEFITQEIALPNGLVVLHRRRQLCWADAGMQRLECIGLNGGGRRVIFAPLGYPFGLTVHNEETFYWTDWEDTKIHSVNINGANHHSFIPSVGGSGKLYGIVLLPEQCPTAESACAINNGGCRFICLPDSRGSRSCLCPDNIPESDCNELNGGSVSPH